MYAVNTAQPRHTSSMDTIVAVLRANAANDAVSHLRWRRCVGPVLTTIHDQLQARFCAPRRAALSGCHGAGAWPCAMDIQAKLRARLTGQHKAKDKAKQPPPTDAAALYAELTAKAARSTTKNAEAGAGAAVTTASTPAGNGSSAKAAPTNSDPGVVTLKAAPASAGSGAASRKRPRPDDTAASGAGTAPGSRASRGDAGAGAGADAGSGGGAAAPAAPKKPRKLDVPAAVAKLVKHMVGRQHPPRSALPCVRSVMCVSLSLCVCAWECTACGQEVCQGRHAVQTAG